MKEKICVKGSAVVRLRKKHAKLSRQKSLAHELTISVRKLRNVETTNDPWDKELATAIAASLGCNLDDIVFSAVGPKLVPPAAPTTLSASIDRSIRGKQLYPRFGTDLAYLVADAGAFFKSTNRADRVLVQNQMALSPDLSGFVDELIDLARSVSGECNPYPYSMSADNAQVPDIQRRMQWLLTWLKGNDIHVFVSDHTKFLPELDELPDNRDWESHEDHAVIAIAPPQEWGETSVNVDVDHGRPYVIDWGTTPFCSAPASS